MGKPSAQTSAFASALTFCRVLPVSSEKLRVCQAQRRTEPPAVRVGQKRKPEEPFFRGPGKNALIITGGWLVRSR